MEDGDKSAVGYLHDLADRIKDVTANPGARDDDYKKLKSDDDYKKLKSIADFLGQMPFELDV